MTTVTSGSSLTTSPVILNTERASCRLYMRATYRHPRGQFVTTETEAVWPREGQTVRVPPLLLPGDTCFKPAHLVTLTLFYVARVDSQFHGELRSAPRTLDSWTVTTLGPGGKTVRNGDDERLYPGDKLITLNELVFADPRAAA